MLIYQHYWQNKCKHISTGLLFGSFFFCSSFWSMFAILSWLMIMSGYFYPLVFAIGCQQKCYHKNSSAKKGKRRCEAAFFKDTQTISVCSTWSPWLKGLVLSKTCGKENRKKSSSTIRRRRILICDTETFMSRVTYNLLCTHCLDNFVKNNQYYEDTKSSKTRDFKLYKSCEAFEEDFSTGKNAVRCYCQDAR